MIICDDEMCATLSKITPIKTNVWLPGKHIIVQQKETPNVMTNMKLRGTIISQQGNVRPIRLTKGDQCETDEKSTPYFALPTCKSCDHQLNIIYPNKYPQRH